MITILKFTHIGDNGDETARYNVEFMKPLTVKELIEHVLTRNEWGNIDIGDTLEIQYIIQYIKDKIIEESDELNKYLNNEISAISARGGWTLMNYHVTLKKEDEYEKT